MRECEGTGKTIEQAVQNALLELRAPREDCDIKVLSEGGFLKKARVLVSISADAQEKYEKKDKIKGLLKEENDEDFAENFMKRKADVQEAKQSVKESQKEHRAEGEVHKITENAQNVQAEEKKQKSKAQADEQVETAATEVKTADRKRTLTGEQFLGGVLDSLGLDAQIEKSEDDKFLRYNLTGDNLNDLIGHHGECMLALSQIMNSVCESGHKKIVLDVENYRARREESLIALAQRTADKVARTGRYFKFEPMDASERKIIHTALQSDERVTTLSKGEEPRRYLIVFPRDYDQRD